MKPLTIQEIKRAISGKQLSALPEHVPAISSICTDTRRIEPGCLFIAIKGDNFDGHDFLPKAAEGGAIAALVEYSPPEPRPNVHMLQVKSTRRKQLFRGGCTTPFCFPVSTRCRIRWC